MARKFLVFNLWAFAEIFTFSTPAPVVSVLADIARYATSSLIRCNVRTCMTSFSARNLLHLKLSNFKLDDGSALKAYLLMRW